MTGAGFWRPQDLRTRARGDFQFTKFDVAVEILLFCLTTIFPDFVSTLATPVTALTRSP